MTIKTESINVAAKVVKVSWLPMIVIALAQIQMGFNVSAPQVPPRPGWLTTTTG